jgi:hypothetical protein
MKTEEYLGGGLYVSFDGYQFCLRAPRENGDDVVYLDPYALANFDKYRERLLSHSEKAL